MLRSGYAMKKVVLQPVQLFLHPRNNVRLQGDHRHCYQSKHRILNKHEGQDGQHGSALEQRLCQTVAYKAR